MTSELINLARGVALKHGLRPEIICAICEQESAWNPFAMRYEPAFMSKYVAPLFVNDNFDATEAYARAISWGLMQVMGQVAREFGFNGRFLAELCDPACGLQIGCAVFARKLTLAGGDTEKALQLFNGGANPAYAFEVLARVEKYAGTLAPSVHS
jgi:soluble lytic murein transglycosylase-like protein